MGSVKVVIVLLLVALLQTTGNADESVPSDEFKTQCPIILHHGFMASRDLGGLKPIDEHLTKRGFKVYRTQVSAANGVPYRGRQLAIQIKQILDDKSYDFERVHIIAISMGGLDARYAISSLGYGEKIASLTTIGTPHRGSLIADLFTLGPSPDRRSRMIGHLNTIMNSIKTDNEVDQQIMADAKKAIALSNKFREDTHKVFVEIAAAINSDTNPADANFWNHVKSLSVSYLREFNRKNPDDPRVYYQSWAGVSGEEGSKDVMKKMLRITQPFLHGHDGPNDGLVTENSAKWGVYRGNVDADHFDLAGVQLFCDQGGKIFPYIQFYEDIAEELAEHEEDILTQGRNFKPD